MFPTPDGDGDTVHSTAANTEHSIFSVVLAGSVTIVMGSSVEMREDGEVQISTAGRCANKVRYSFACFASRQPLHSPRIRLVPESSRV